MLNGKKLLLIIGGGIAAYKCLELIRLARKEGAQVRCVLTKAGGEFITPLSVSSLTGEKVFTDLFDLTDEAEIGHIQLSRDADLLIVAPATADMMGKMATGRADDLASTLLLATDKPVLIAPAMNVKMWLHPATQRNLVQLKHDNVHLVGPNEGDMACGEFGPGRMAEPTEILTEISRLLGGRASALLDGKRALVTAGPTHEPIDPVRYIANRSSGKQGYAIASALAGLGAETTLVSGPTALSDPSGVNTIRVETATEMLTACEQALPADVAVCTAAVADWRVAMNSEQKIKKSNDGPPDLSLIENPDILATLGGLKDNRPALLIGFAAETQNLVANAQKKLLKKGCDWIVANDVSSGTTTMGGDTNQVHLMTSDRHEIWEDMPKSEVASRLALQIAEAIGASA